MSAIPPGEFSLIARHFRPLAGPAGLDLLDDAALLAPPAGRELVIAADAMVAGVHCLPDDPPGLVARKLLRVNLSDLAAMGAVPLGYLLTLAAPRDTPDAWFAAFAAGLAADQAEFGLALLGGDTTATPGPLRHLPQDLLDVARPCHTRSLPLLDRQGSRSRRPQSDL
jgi:thiamine-monophosphate kinase